MFWSYQDSVGPDNFHTFKLSEPKNRPNVRGQARQKICNYKGAFQERFNAVKLCEILQQNHTKINLYLDIKKIEDLEFDKLIGKAGLSEDSQGEFRLMTENEINNSPDFELPILTRKQQQ
jgi:hypothetical protein